MASPWILGTKAPVDRELDVTDLKVEGALPPELQGRLVRMTPNPIGPVGEDHVWFAGDGMVHAIDLQGGRATRFLNRWVRTVPAAEELDEPTPLAPVEDGVDLANTSALWLAGRLLALTETCPPYLLDGDLRTVGREDFGGGVRHFTAHPHVDPASGDVIGVGYRTDQEASCTLHVIGPDGLLRTRQDIDLIAPRAIHDIAVTDRHVVLWDLPLEIDPAAPEPRFPFAWNRDAAGRIGLIERAAPDRAPRWHEVDPCWVFHPLNAFDTPDGGVTLFVCQFERIMDQDRTGPGDPFPPQLWRWTIDGRGGLVRRERIDDRIQEFPRMDPRFWSRRNRFGFTTELFSRAGRAALLVHDLERGEARAWEAEPGRSLSEAVFVPAAATSSEGEGWLLAIDSTPDHSDLVVLDATAVVAGPVARVRLPQRIPDGFHGDWIPANVR